MEDVISSEQIQHRHDESFRVSMILITARKRSLRRLCFHRCLSVSRGICPIAYWDTPPPPGRHPLARHPSWADTRPCTVHAGIQQIPTGQTPPWVDTRPCTVHAGIQSTRGRYAFHFNAFLFKVCSYSTYANAIAIAC